MSLYQQLQQARSEEAYKTLTLKLQPQVYELGFLKN